MYYLDESTGEPIPSLHQTLPRNTWSSYLLFFLSTLHLHSSDLQLNCLMKQYYRHNHAHPQTLLSKVQCEYTIGMPKGSLFPVSFWYINPKRGFCFVRLMFHHIIDQLHSLFWGKGFCSVYTGCVLLT